MSEAITAATVVLARSIHGPCADHEDFDYYRKHVEAAAEAMLPHLVANLAEVIDKACTDLEFTEFDNSYENNPDGTPAGQYVAHRVIEHMRSQIEEGEK